MGKLCCKCQKPISDRSYYKYGITLQQEIYAQRLLKILGRNCNEINKKLREIELYCQDIGRSQTTDLAGKMFADFIDKLESEVTTERIFAQIIFSKLKVNDQLRVIQKSFRAEGEGYWEDFNDNLREIYFDHLYNSDIKSANLALIIEIYRSNSGAIFSKLIDRIIGSAALLYILKKLIDY